MKFEQIALPYAKDALEPCISARTVDIHYSKHHAGYVRKLNDAVKDDSSLERDLETLVQSLPPGKPFNFASQIWNHDFYWQSIGPDGGGKPEGELAERITRDFGSFKQLRQALAEAASDEFGSGWAWLTVDNTGKLSVLSTTDAENPLQSSLVPLITIDVWEHAYYLDYRNERDKYIEAYLDELVQWDFAAKNLDECLKGMQAAEEVS